MTQRQMAALHELFRNMHENPPPPFNLDARPGIHAEVSQLQAKYWEDNPGSTREQAKEHYRLTYERLIPRYPTYREIAAKEF